MKFSDLSLTVLRGNQSPSRHETTTYIPKNQRPVRLIGHGEVLNAAQESPKTTLIRPLNTTN